MFRKSQDELHYLGGEERRFNVDHDELCWLWLEELAKKCGPYMKIEEIYYLISGKSLEDRLRRVYVDKEVLQMAEIVFAYGCIDFYVLHGVDEPNFVPMIDTSAQEAQQHRRRMTLRRPTLQFVAPQLSLETYSL